MKRRCPLCGGNMSLFQSANSSDPEILVEDKTDWGTNLVKVRVTPFIHNGDTSLLYACDRCGNVQLIKENIRETI